jgi:hypothetical protein
MNVDYPSNVDDESLHSVQPLHIPTQTTYSIFRSKFSDILRQIIDTSLSLKINVEHLPYSTVLEFDKKLNDLILEVPPYFRMDSESLLQSKATFAERPHLEYQSRMAYFSLHTRLIRLHRPFLTRGLNDHRYSYSRMVCLRSTRCVIAIGKAMRTEQNWYEPARVWTTTNHIFLATIILVMDFCFTREESRKKEKKAEILDRFRLLEKCEKESTIARRGLEQLKSTLKKWKHGGRHTADDQNLNTVENRQKRMRRNSTELPVEQEETEPTSENSEHPLNTVETMGTFQVPSNSLQGGSEGDWSNRDILNDSNSWAQSFDFNFELNSDDWETLLRQIEGYDVYSSQSVT